MRRTGLLARLADLGYHISDDSFTNWGRPGRAFPRDWSLLRALIAVVSDRQLPGRCTAAEGLRFFTLTELPFAELRALAALFPAEELSEALRGYLPDAVACGAVALMAPASQSYATLAAAYSRDDAFGE